MRACRIILHYDCDAGPQANNVLAFFKRIRDEDEGRVNGVWEIWRFWEIRLLLGVFEGRLMEPCGPGGSCSPEVVLLS